MAILTPSQLVSASNATYFNNVSGSITPDNVRNLNDNWISSSILVSQTSSLSVLSSSYALTASFALNAGTSIDTGSFVNTSSFNSYTASINSFTGSIQSQVNNLQAATASYITSAQTSSMTVLSSSYALTASVVTGTVVSASNALTASYVNPLNQNVDITGRLYVSSSDLQDVVVNGRVFISASGNNGRITVSGSADNRSIISSNSISSTGFISTTLGAATTELFSGYVASYSDIDVIGFAANATSASANGWTSGPVIYNATTSSTEAVIGFQGATNYGDGRVTILKPLVVSGSATVSGSVNATSFSGSGASIVGVVSSSYALTASYALNASIETGSFATTGSNTFTGTNSFNIISASFASVVSASIEYLSVVYQTSSVIFSSGSNIFGDNANDTQTLFGTVDIRTGPLKVTGSLSVTGSTDLTNLTASGLRYPTTDGLEGQVLKTDGTNDLAFGDVNTMYETVYTGENITKSDPLYISGSQGANPIVYKADAANAAKMPVSYIASETIAAGNTTRGIVLGLIEGIDLTGYVAGTEVYVAAGGGWTSTRPTGSAIVQVLGVVTKGGSGGKGLVLNPGPVNLPNLAEGNVWLGNASGVPVAVTGSSLYVDNAVSASYALTASYALNSSLETGSFATTGSNTFTGTQTIVTGSSVKFQMNTSTQSLQLQKHNALNELIVINPDNNEKIIGFDYDTLYTRIQFGIDTGIRFEGIDAKGRTINISSSLELQNTLNVLGDSLLTGSLVVKPSQLSTEYPFAIIQASDGTSRGGNLISARNTSVSTSGSIIVSGSQNLILLSGGGDTSEFGTGSASGFSGTNSIITNVPFITGSNGYGNDRPVPTFINSVINRFVNVTDNRPATTTTPLTLTSVNSNSTINYTTSTGSLTITNSNFAGTGISVTVTGSNGLAKTISSIGVIGNQNTLLIDSPTQATHYSGLFVGGNSNIALISGSQSTMQSVNLIGYQLRATGSLVNTANYGSLFAGRWNAIDNTAFVKETAFAVGTGAANASRRTSFHVSASGLTTVSNGLTVTGSTSSSFNVASTFNQGVTFNQITAFNQTPSFNAQANFGNVVSFTGSRFAATINNTNDIEVLDANRFGINVRSKNFSTSGSEYFLNVDTGSNTTSHTLNAQYGGTVGSIILSNTTGSSRIQLNANEVMVSGSLSGNVVSASIASDTASFNFNQGNFFTSLVSGSTNFDITNPEPGQTVNVLLTTAGTGASASFSSNVKQVSGSVYTPTSTDGAKDILTFISWDASSVYLANVKNLI
jgi:hypothetical protein